MKKKKTNNFLTGTADNSICNPEKIEKSVAVQLSEEVENQYRVFSEDIKSVKEEMSKIHKELLNQVACLHLKMSKFDEKGDSALVVFVKSVFEANYESMKGRLLLLENRFGNYINEIFWIKEEIKKLQKEKGEK